MSVIAPCRECCNHSTRCHVDCSRYEAYKAAKSAEAEYTALKLQSLRASATQAEWVKMREKRSKQGRPLSR